MRALLVISWLSACQSGGSGALSGSVVIDGDSDASGVLVRAVGKKSVSTMTDGGGSYRFASLPDGEYTLVFSAEATLEDQKVVNASVTRGESQAPEVRFTAAGGVSGQVTLEGQPGPGAAVFVVGQSAVAIADAGGNYTLAKIPAGAISLEAVLSGYRPGTLDGLTVARGKTASAPRLDLQRDDSTPYAVAALSGVARRMDRSDSSGTTVTASRGTTTLATSTAADGSYHFDGISPGVYRLDFSYGGKSEFIPQVLALAGSTGQVIDGALYPLESNPLNLPTARRLVQGGWAALLVDETRVLIQPSWTALQLLSLDTGSVTPLADDVADPSPLVLAPDHSSVLYLGGVGQNYYAGALRTVALSGNTPSTLAPLAASFQFTTDGSRIVYLDRWDESLFSVPASGGDPLTLGAKVQYHALVPDGTRVVYESCDGPCQVLVRTVDGGAPTQLFAASGSMYLSPDGAQVAALDGWDSYAGTGKLWVAAVDGSGATQLWDGTVADFAQFSADGRWLIFVTNKTELRLFDCKSRGAPALVAQNVAYPNMAPDGRFLYLRDLMTPTRLGTLAQQPAGGGAEMVLGTRVDKLQQLSPDGTLALFRDQIDAALGTGRVRVAGASGAVIAIGDGAQLAQFSSDGKYVHYTVPAMPDHSTVYSVPAAGGAAVRLGDTYFAGLTESPAGGWVSYFVTGGVATISPSGGGAPQVVGNGDIDFVSEHRIILNNSYTQPPYRHQNGIYLYEVTP